MNALTLVFAKCLEIQLFWLHNCYFLLSVKYFFLLKGPYTNSISCAVLVEKHRQVDLYTEEVMRPSIDLRNDET